jgi:uncharacterized membrane protein YkoI
MKRFNRITLMAVLASAVAVTLAIAADVEEPVTLNDLPPKVRATIVEAAKGGEIREIEREMADGHFVYEAEIVIDGRESEIVVAADGSILERALQGDDDDDDDESDGDDDGDGDGDDSDDETISLNDVPDAARLALLEQAGGQEILEVEVERGADGAMFYEAAWRVDGRMNEVMVMANGALVSLEQVVDPYSVPAAVRAASEKLLESCPEITYERRVIVVYSVTGKADGEIHGATISPTGRVLGSR